MQDQYSAVIKQDDEWWIAWLEEVAPVSRPRLGWEEKFRVQAESPENKMLDEDTGQQTEWDKDEWVW